MRTFLWLMFTAVVVLASPASLSEKYPSYRMNRSIMTVMT